MRYHFLPKWQQQQQKRQTFYLGKCLGKGNFQTLMVRMPTDIPLWKVI